ncbi:MAG: alpha/beta hydrolase [Gammaproteobacteria bacterium]|nr:MAG: alpha/beta hydrolase [Gammaproteobacteria bacterium]
MPSQEHEALVAALQEGGAVDVPSVEEQRANYDAMLCANPILAAASIEELIIGQCNADWVTVPVSREDRVILYLHGGGYVIGSNVAFREFASRLAQANRARVCLLDYRLAPEHPFPAAVDDAVAAFGWLLDQGVDPAGITVAGDSAGGGLTLATLLTLRDAGGPQAACGVCFSPWADLAGTGASAQPGAVDDPLVTDGLLADMSQAYAGEDLRNPLASPLYADYEGLPPLFLLVGDREMLLDDATRVADKARNAGVDVSYFQGDGLVHVWPVLAPTAPESEAALEQMAGFTERHWR